MKQPNMLSASFVKTVKTLSRNGDGRGGLGLSFLVRTVGHGHITKCWSQSEPIHRRRISIAIECLNSTIPRAISARTLYESNRHREADLSGFAGSVQSLESPAK